MTTYPADDFFAHLPHPALYWPGAPGATPDTPPVPNAAYQRMYGPGTLPDPARGWPDGPQVLRLEAASGETRICRVTLATLPGGARLATIEDVHGYHTDPLTGLLDRRALKLDERTQTPGSVVLLDIDAFKTVNDTLGHAAGDDVLCALATLLATTARAWGGHAYRLGGDEFILHTPRPVAADHLERLQVQFEQAAWRLGVPGGHVCAGSAHAPQHGNTLAHLILHADAHLGEHKRDRRGSVARQLNNGAAGPDQPATRSGWVNP